MKKAFLSVGVLIAACGAMASDVFVTPYSVEKVRIETDTVQADRVVVGTGGAVRKTGEGKWIVPSGKLAQEWPARIEVEEGQLDLQASTAERFQFADVSNVLGRAASWFDSSVEASRVTDGGGALTDWLDVRETGNETAGYDLVRATVNHIVTDASPVYQEDPTYGKSGIYFGGYGSGQWVNFVDSEGNDFCHKAYHVFAIHGEVNPNNGFSAIFGVRWKSFSSNTAWMPYFAFCPGGTGKGPYSLWTYYNADMLPIYNGRTYVNGRMVNPFERNTTEPNRMPRGFSLLEAEMLNNPGLVSCLQNDRDYVNDSKYEGMQYNQWAGMRQGGDYICEVLVFTNRLTTAERMKVASYLMNKWLGAQSVPSVTVALAKDAKLSLPPSGLAVSVEGEGQIVKSGDADAALSLTTGPAGYCGSVRLAEGGLKTCAIFPLDLACGETLTASQDYPWLHLARTAGDKADTLVKGGDGALTVQSVSGPEEKSVLRVDGGKVTLTARRRQVLKPFVPDVARVRAIVPNASFEDNMSATQTKPLGAGANDWHGQIDGSGEVFFFNWTVNKGGDHDGQYWRLPQNPPDGVTALGIKQSASAWTEVVIPEDGRYELSFYAAGRQGNSADLALDLMIGPDADSLQRIGGFRNVHTDHYYDLDPVNGRQHYYRYSYMTPHLTAGKHQLWFRHTEQTTDRCVLIDCVELVKEDFAADGVWKIPNGNFCDLNTSYTTFTDPNHFVAANAAALAGWTVVQPTSPANALYDIVAPALLQMCRSNQTAPWTGRFYCNSYGDTGLQLNLTKGGTASTTFTPPKGVFLLRGRMAMMLTHSLCGNIIQLHASVTPDGGDVQDLGSVCRNQDTAMSESVFPVAFESDGVTPVTLTIWVDSDDTSNPTAANAVVAGLALVPAENNLVENGGFDNMTGWTVEKGNETWYPGGYNYNNNVGWGASRYNGHAYCLKMTGPGTVYRAVTFPEPGLYRLQAAAKTRIYDGKLSASGPNALHFYVARGGVTNEIASWSPVNTNYVEDAWCFRVTEAGEYDFGIIGVPPPNKNQNPLDMTSFVDGVKITKANFETETPNLSEHARIRVAEGAKLRLDFSGTNKVAGVRLGGVGRYGIVTAETDPDYVSGPGALEVVPDTGAVIIFR